MDLPIVHLDTADYPRLVEVWEASVRATHHFLKEEDIQFFKPLILNEYLKALDLRGLKDERGLVAGFLGFADQKIEMLFIHPESMGRGLGKALLQFALKEMKANKVDVNEANQQAVGFYERMGFRTVRRSPVDGAGKAYPLLHMVFTEQNSLALVPENAT